MRSSSTLDPADSRCGDRPLQSAPHRARLSTDPTFKSRLHRLDALRKRLVELDGPATRPFDYRGRTRRQFQSSSVEDLSRTRAFTPRSSPQDEIWVEAASRPGRQAAELVKNALFLICGVAVLGWFAVFVHETQINAPLRGRSTCRRRRRPTTRL